MKQYIIGGSVLSFFVAGLIFAQSQGVINLSRHEAEDLKNTTSTVSENEKQVAVNPFGEGAERIGELKEHGEDSAESKGKEIENEDEDEDDEKGVSQSVPPVVNPTPSPITSTPATGSGGISSATLALHNKQSDCWVGYQGVVYNITSWLPRHPGSAGAIAPYCGTSKEFTTAFTAQHGTSQVGRLKSQGSVEGTLTK
jgi:cytochrome b involved in lipid metabolism